LKVKCIFSICEKPLNSGSYKLNILKYIGTIAGCSWENGKKRISSKKQMENHTSWREDQE